VACIRGCGQCVREGGAADVGREVPPFILVCVEARAAERAAEQGGGGLHCVERRVYAAGRRLTRGAGCACGGVGRSEGAAKSAVAGKARASGERAA
jgi:hypothetical protein